MRWKWALSVLPAQSTKSNKKAVQTLKDNKLTKNSTRPIPSNHSVNGTYLLDANTQKLPSRLKSIHPLKHLLSPSDSAPLCPTRQNSCNRYKQRFSIHWKRVPLILDTGSVEAIIASAHFRKFCPVTVVQPILAIIQGVTGHQLSWSDRNSDSVNHRLRCADSVSGHAKGHNTSWPKSNEATVSQHHA